MAAACGLCHSLVSSAGATELGSSGMAVVLEIDRVAAMSTVPQPPPASSIGARRTMVANKRKDTSIELAVRHLLHARGARYRVDFAPDPSDRRRRADIVFTGAKIAVFLDGCFWHGCPDHYVEPRRNVEYWAPKIARNIARDRETTARLTMGGWNVLRFWEHESPQDIANAVLGAVASRRAERGM